MKLLWILLCGLTFREAKDTEWSLPWASKDRLHVLCQTKLVWWLNGFWDCFHGQPLVMRLWRTRTSTFTYLCFREAICIHKEPQTNVKTPLTTCSTESPWFLTAFHHLHPPKPEPLLQATVWLIQELQPKSWSSIIMRTSLLGTTMWMKWHWRRFSSWEFV